MRRATPFVLVVDSYPDAAESMQQVLTLHGFHAGVARSCAEAVAAAHARPPVAVVTELTLPDGDGGKLAERLRAMGHPAPAVIGMSDRPLAGVFDHCFTKPADPRVLVEVLRRYAPA